MSDCIQHPAVLCDMCTEEDRKPARKTCMKCEISMCVQHLQAHLTTPVLLQTHPLTEPLAPGEATKCPQHGKVLEYYCLDDLTCVCVSCAIEDQHRLHNMKTISTAHKELTERLAVEKQALAATAVAGETLEKWEKAERRKLAQSGTRLVEAVSKLRDLALSRVQHSVSARTAAIGTGQGSVRAAQGEKDTFRFLQMFSGVHRDVERAKALDLRKGLEPGSDRDELVRQLRQEGDKMVDEAVQLWGSLLVLVDPENHHEDRRRSDNSEDVTFDPKSLRKGMMLSGDHRRVYYCNLPAVKRPAHTLRIQGAPSNASWTISLPEDCDWTVGICDKASLKNLKDGHVYGLCCQGRKLSSLTSEYREAVTATVEAKAPGCFAPQVQNNLVGEAGVVQAAKKRKVSYQLVKDLQGDGGEKGDEGEESRPHAVEVLWDVPTSSLSFFNRSGPHRRTEILTITAIDSSWDLFPFVHLGAEEGSGDVAQQRAQAAPQQPQQQWECLCGQVYNKSGDTYYNHNHGSRCAKEYFWNTCSCGGAVGEPPITDILCELV